MWEVIWLHGSRRERALYICGQRLTQARHLDNRMTHRHTNKYTLIKSRHTCFRHFNLAVVSLQPPTLCGHTSEAPLLCWFLFAYVYILYVCFCVCTCMSVKPWVCVSVIQYVYDVNTVANIISSLWLQCLFCHWPTDGSKWYKSIYSWSQLKYLSGSRESVGIIPCS